MKYTFEEGSEPIPCEMYIDLSVFSAENDFDPDELTRILRIEPTLAYHKGDFIRKDLYRKETCWRLNTPRIETFEFEEIFHVLTNILDGKMDALRNYAKDNGLSIKIYPVIAVSNTMPAIVITKETTDTLLLLNATMEFDMYFA